MLSLFVCSECGADRSHNAPGGQPANGHAPTCPFRGARTVWLTMMTPSAPGIVAQCADGHEFWQGDRRRGEWAHQVNGAEQDVLKHNFEVHGMAAG